MRRDSASRSCLSSPKAHSDYPVQTNVQLPTDTRLRPQDQVLSDEPPDTATRRECPFGRREYLIVRKLFPRSKQSASHDHERRDRSRFAIDRADEIKRHIAGQHQMAVILTLDVSDFRAEAHSRQDVESRGSTHKAFRHDAIVCKQKRSSRKFTCRPGALLGGRWMRQQRADQGERENRPKELDRQDGNCDLGCQLRGTRRSYLLGSKEGRPA